MICERRLFGKKARPESGLWDVEVSGLEGKAEEEVGLLSVEDRGGLSKDRNMTCARTVTMLGNNTQRNTACV